MVFAPSLTMAEFALRPNLPSGAMGGPNDRYTLANIAYLFGESVHRAIFFKTVWASRIVAALIAQLTEVIEEPRQPHPLPAGRAAFAARSR
jgi:hypothetical protein